MKILVLDTITKSIKAKLAKTVTTAQPSVVSTWADSSDGIFVEGSTETTLSNTSKITIIPAPYSNYRRIIKSITILNNDTVPVDITIIYDHNGLETKLCIITLLPEQSWSFDGIVGSNGSIDTIVQNAWFSIGVDGILKVIDGVVETAIPDTDYETPYHASTTYEPKITRGILNTNAVIIDSITINNGEYAKFTANGLESKTSAEVIIDLGVLVPGDIIGKENTSNKETVALDSSTTKYPNNAVVKAYIDNAVTSLLDYRGGYNASGNTYPTTGGSGVAGAVMKGDMWIISTSGTLGGNAIQIGDSIIANIDTPGQTTANWNTLNSNITYVPEDSVNKVTVLSDASTDVQYPSAKVVYNGLAGKQPTGAYLVAADIINKVDKVSGASLVLDTDLATIKHRIKMNVVNSFLKY